MEFKLKTTELFVTLLSITVAVGLSGFLAWLFISHPYGVKDELPFLDKIFFYIFSYLCIFCGIFLYPYLMFHMLSCNCKMLVVDTENKLLKLKLKNNDIIDVPFEDVTKIYTDKCLVYIKLNNDAEYSVAFWNWGTFFSLMPKEMIEKTQN